MKVFCRFSITKNQKSSLNGQVSIFGFHCVGKKKLEDQRFVFNIWFIARFGQIILRMIATFFTFSYGFSSLWLQTKIL
jgi:hypothetical protein